MFWPTRLTYSTTTGSVMRWADFSISMEYCLPVPISQLVEYQLARPRPPMLRVPMASTSSSLPFLMCGSSASPGEGRTSVLAVSAVLAAGGLLECRMRCPAWLPVLALASLGTPKAGGPSCWRTVGWALRPAGWMPRAFLPAKRAALRQERLPPVRSPSNPQGWSPMGWSQGSSRKARVAARWRLRRGKQGRGQQGGESEVGSRTHQGFSAGAALPANGRTPTLC